MEQALRNNQFPEDVNEFNEWYSDISDIHDLDTSRSNSALIGGYRIFPFFPAFWPQICNFPMRKDDVIIATFPKSGTTWMQQLLYLVTTQDFEGANKVRVDLRAPFIEFPKPCTNAALDELANRTTARVLKTHLPVTMLPKNACNGKVIYVHRNPKDVAVSYYHHYRAWNRAGPKYEHSFEKFCRDFMADECKKF